MEEIVCVAKVWAGIYTCNWLGRCLQIYTKMEDEQKVAVKYIKKEMARAANCGR